MKELNSDEIVSVTGGFWGKAATYAIAFHMWYQSSGMIDHGVDVGVAP